MNHLNFCQPSRELELLHNVCRKRSLDEPRFVYADYLDAHGRQMQAEYIRASIMFARLGGVTPPEGAAPIQTARDFLHQFGIMCRHFPNVPRVIECAYNDQVMRFVLSGRRQDWHRGFQAHLHTLLPAWMETGPLMVQMVPLENVVIGDRTPYHDPTPANLPGTEHVWIRSSPASYPGMDYHIPAEVFDLLRHVDPSPIRTTGALAFYPDAASAQQSLNQAALLYARTKAGIP